MKNQRKQTKSKGATAPRASKRTNGGSDAIEVLERQHREVEALIARFEDGRTNEDARALDDDVCDTLTVHATIEEEI